MHLLWTAAVYRDPVKPFFHSIQCVFTYVLDCDSIYLYSHKLLRYHYINLTLFFNCFIRPNRLPAHAAPEAHHLHAGGIYTAVGLPGEVPQLCFLPLEFYGALCKIALQVGFLFSR